jgi:hypothetical protein
MMCGECPFHLVCQMGRLGGKKSDERSLCPTCGKLELLGEKEDAVFTVYKFNCELRPLTPEIRNKFNNRMIGRRARRHDGHIVATYKESDPVDERLLNITECLECSKSPLRLIAHVRIIDLDSEWEDEERRKRHVFRLRTARENQK